MRHPLVQRGKLVADPDAILARPIRDYRDFVDAIFRCYADAQGKPRWGDKTPFYTPDIDIIRRVFPDAKIVHLVRDGRDVVLSQRSIVDVWEPAEAGVGLAVEDHHRPQKIGRASCRERVGKYV